MKRFRSTRRAQSALLLVLVLAAPVFMGGGTANAAPITPIGLGTATNFAIRADDQITNVPMSAITGDVGLSPGTAFPGLTCAEVTGTIYQVAGGTGPAPCTVTDPALMTTVANDALTAFNHTSALPGATPIGPDLTGLNLVAGLYSFGAPATNLAGALTLNAQGDPSSVWVFQASSSLITSVGSTMGFTNLPAGVTAAQLACNVFWTVGSDATINGSTFVGTILASASITVGGGATVTGRLLAGNAAGTGGQVTLIMDTIVRPPGCAVLPPGTGGNPIVPPTAPPSAPPAPPVQSPPTFTG